MSIADRYVIGRDIAEKIFKESKYATMKVFTSDIQKEEFEECKEYIHDFTHTFIDDLFTNCPEYFE